MVNFNSYVSLPEGIDGDSSTFELGGGCQNHLRTRQDPLSKLDAQLQSEQKVWLNGPWNLMVTYRYLGLSENRVYSQTNSHLIGIMIINHWV